MVTATSVTVPRNLVSPRHFHHFTSFWWVLVQRKLAQQLKDRKRHHLREIFSENFKKRSTEGGEIQFSFASHTLPGFRLVFWCMKAIICVILDRIKFFKQAKRGKSQNFLIIQFLSVIFLSGAAQSSPFLSSQARSVIIKLHIRKWSRCTTPLRERKEGKNEQDTEQMNRKSKCSRYNKLDELCSHEENLLSSSQSLFSFDNRFYLSMNKI